MAADAVAVRVSWELRAYLYFASVGLALSMIDFDTKRLPNRITLPSYVVMGTLLLIPVVADGDFGDYTRAWLAALVLYAFYFVIAFIYPAGMGFGDVKLAGVLGLALGWLRWGERMVGGFLGFLLGAVAGITLMVVGRAGRRSALRSAPPWWPVPYRDPVGDRIWSRTPACSAERVQLREISC